VWQKRPGALLNLRRMLILEFPWEYYWRGEENLEEYGSNNNPWETDIDAVTVGCVHKSAV
jgi:hypothetical protein